MKFLKRDKDEEARDDLHEDPVDDLPDVLKLLRIAPVIEIPEKVLTPENLQGVKLRPSRPEGYFFDDVDALLNSVIGTTEWYIEQLSRRDEDIARLATELDRAATDLENVKNEREWALGSQAINTPEDSEEVARLQTKVNELEELLAHSKRAAATPATATVVAKALSDEDAKELNDLRTWAAQAEASFAALEAELAEARSQLENSDGEIPSLNDEIIDLTQTNENLRLQLDELQQEHDALKEWADDAERVVSERDEAYQELDARYQELLRNTSTNVGVVGAVASVPTIVEPQSIDSEPYAEVNEVYEESVEADATVYDTSAADYAYQGDSTDVVQDTQDSTLPVYEEDDDEEQSVFDVNEDDVAEFGSGSSVQIPTEDDPFIKVYEDFARDFESESDAPELGEGIQYVSEKKQDTDRIVPGSPLKSIPPDADISDYL